MNQRHLLTAAVGLTAAALFTALSLSQALGTRHRPERDFSSQFDRTVAAHAQTMIAEGQRTFRYDTFGDEDFWGGALRLHQAIEGAANGGVGDGVSPRTALAVGLKVDSDALTREVKAALRRGEVNLDDPAVTLQLLRRNAVVGLTGFFDGSGHLSSVGIQCALCHSTVDNALAPGIGHRLDGWANRDLDVGKIVSLAPDLSPLTTLLGVPDSTVRNVLLSWGPGKFDAELVLDGKAFQPDGRSAATLLPPAFGLAGVNLHTWEGWGSVTHWNAFVANLEMHGHGTFFDPRLDNAAQFPIAATHGFGHVRSEPDRITAKLPALHFYQLAIPAPAPPRGSFDPDAAERGDQLFSGKAKCASCHVDELYTEPGWNMHTGEEIGIDNFQADRGPDHRYRTSPLKGLWTHAKGGFYHDGRFATLLDVVNHYDSHFALGLTEPEKQDLVAYLNSLGDDVAPNVRNATTLNLGAEAISTLIPTGPWRLSVGPTPATRESGLRMRLYSSGATSVPSDMTVSIFDVQGRRVSSLDATKLLRPGVSLVDGFRWNGRNAAGQPVAAGVYFIRASAPSAGYKEDRRVVLR